MTQQISIDSAALIDESNGRRFIEVTSDIAYKRLLFVNVVFLGTADNWYLVDAGIAGSAPYIIKAAEERFGPGTKPKAILLTHGHFDHVGALRSLIDEWNIPVYAHENEVNFLNGKSSYPAPDPSVGGGLMSLLSPLFPSSPIDISDHLAILPTNGEVPGLNDWQWIPTPGHSHGHVSYWREADRILLSGDAVITTAQESAYGAITQEAEIHGPPKYFTPDWIAAEESVARIAALRPSIVIPGHGRAIQGDKLQAGLDNLSSNFKEIGVPRAGRYVLEKSKSEGDDKSMEAGHVSKGQLPLVDENISIEPSNTQKADGPG